MILIKLIYVLNYFTGISMSVTVERVRKARLIVKFIENREEEHKTVSKKVTGRLCKMKEVNDTFLYQKLV